MKSSIFKIKNDQNILPKLVSSKSELKKIKLFNTFCYLWYVVASLLILGRIIKYQTIIDFDITIHLLFIFIIVCIQFIHSYGYYKLSRSLFITLLIMAVYIFCNYMVPGKMREFYFLLIPPVTLIFIDNKFLKYSFTILAFICFSAPNLIYEYYDFWSFNDPTQSLLFFSIFIIVNYFKNLNLKNERTLELKKNELEKVNKHQSQFFINISHEIRTPITLIKGHIEELKQFLVSEPQLTKIQKGLNLQVNQIKSMVDDVLDSAKMKSSDFKLNFTIISLTDLVNEIYLSFETNFRLKNINFNLNNLNRNYEMTADFSYLKRALNNLLVNALKYTDKGGNVSIEIIKQEQNLVISINDSGIGISEKDIDKICNQFYQVDNDINRSGGSGIGLSFSKEIIELHGGELKIVSELNKGSEFKIIFPIKECVIIGKGSYQLIRNDHFTNQLILKKNKKDKCFLIVDDNREMRQYLNLILENYECIEAENGLEALELLENYKVDFIITDYMMPKMDGLDFLKELKEKKYQMPVLMLTARVDKESRLNSFRIGIDDYLNKPFDKDELLVRVENALTNHLNRIEYIDEKDIEEEELDITKKWMQEVEQYIFQNCANLNFKQIDIAEFFSISESSLYRKIKSCRGKTPNQFITELKLQKARKIIENNPETSLKRLSLEVGFKHYHYFSDMYFKRFGNKPWNKN